MPLTPMQAGQVPSLHLSFLPHKPPLLPGPPGLSHFSLPSKGRAAAGDTLTSDGQGQGRLSHSKDAHVYGE